MGGDPQAIIETLGLAPHPEGGWYRETWREGADAGCRGLATGIYFLLEAGQRSHWHRVDAAELWLFHAGTPLTLSIAAGDAGPVEAIIVGPRSLQRPSPAGDRAEGLVSCIVSPGFEFAGWELAAPGWRPGD